MFDLRSIPDLDGALCAQIGGDLWHPEKGENATAAKRICQRCPVQQACLQWALDNHERSGIWGGLTGRERRPLKREAVAD